MWFKVCEGLICASKAGANQRLSSDDLADRFGRRWDVDGWAAGWEGNQTMLLKPSLLEKQAKNFKNRSIAIVFSVGKKCRATNDWCFIKSCSRWRILLKVAKNACHRRSVLATKLENPGLCLSRPQAHHPRHGIAFQTKRRPGP